MNLIRRYKNLRKASMALNSKMLDVVHKQHLINAATKLGIFRNSIFLLESENEQDYLSDFVIHEWNTTEGKKLYDAYALGQEASVTSEEKEIIDAYKKSYTSLFEVVLTDPITHHVWLRNLVAPEPLIPIIDIGFSQSMETGGLVFMRIVPFPDLSMGSGLSFVFPSQLKSYVLRKMKKSSKRNDDAVAKFVTFFALNRTDGMEVIYR